MSEIGTAALAIAETQERNLVVCRLRVARHSKWASAFRGFLFHHSAALGDVLLQDAEAAELALAAARRRAGAAHPAQPLTSVAFGLLRWPPV